MRKHLETCPCARLATCFVQRPSPRGWVDVGPRCDYHAQRREVTERVLLLHEYEAWKRGKAR